MADVTGLDLGSQVVRSAVVDGSGKTLLSVESHSLENVESTSELLKEEFASFGRKSIWIALNDRESLSRDFKVPFTDPDQIKQTIRFSAEEIIPDDVDNYLIDYQIIETLEAETRLMVVAGRRQDVGEKIQMLQSVGLDPEGMTHNAVALYNLATRVCEAREHDEPFIIIDAGAATVDIIVGDRDKLQFVRSIIIQQSGDRSELLEGERFERVLKEIKRTLWSGGVDGLAEFAFVCGGLAENSQAIQLIGETLDIRAEPFPVAEAFGKVEANEGHLALYATATAIALDGVLQPKFPINYRREEFVQTPILLKIGPALMLLLIMAIGILGYDCYRQMQQKTRLHHHVNAQINWERTQFIDFWGTENEPAPELITEDPTWLASEFSRYSQGFNVKSRNKPDVAHTFKELARQLVKFPKLQIESLSITSISVELAGKLPSNGEVIRLEDAFKDDRSVFMPPQRRGAVKDGAFKMSLILKKDEGV